MRTGIIYICVNLFDGKRYIGQTCQRFEHRKQQHIDDAFNRGSELYFHRALRKFGLENFIWSVLERNIPIDKLNDKEIYYITKYKTNDRNNGYNLTLGGNQSYSSILTPNQVEEIRSLLKNTETSVSDIAEKYKIGTSSISDINNGDTWFDKDIVYPLRTSIYDRKLTEEDVLKIYDMLRDGVSFQDIGKLFQCSTTNISNINYGKVHKYLNDSNYPISPKKFSHLSQEEVDNIVYLLINTNLTHNEIGKEVGVKREIVKNINNGYHKKVKGITEFPIRKRQIIST